MNQTKPALHKRVSCRAKARIVAAALERQGQLSLLLTACLAQAGGDILLKKSTLDRCVRDGARLGFSLHDLNATECSLRLLGDTPV